MHPATLRFFARRAHGFCQGLPVPGSRGPFFLLFRPEGGRGPGENASSALRAGKRSGSLISRDQGPWQGSFALRARMGNGTGGLDDCGRQL